MRNVSCVQRGFGPLVSIALSLMLLAATVVQAAQPVADEVLVKFKPGISDATARARIESYGGEVIKRIDGIDVYWVKIVDNGTVAQTIAEFTADPDVEYAETNTVGGPGYVPNDPALGTGSSAQWHHSKLNTYGAWDITQGSTSVRVAILDTGWEPSNQEFSGSRFVPGRDIINNDNDPTADHAHGVWTLGFLTANADNGIGGAGTAPNITAQIIKMLNSSNGSTDAQFAQGVIAAADLTPAPHIMSMSLINYQNSQTNRSAMQYARDKGIILIVCAGNGGVGNADTQAPSNTGLGITIGATDINNQRGSFSGTGARLDFMAPGAAVRGMVPGSNGTQFQTINGCSFATPMAAGIAALMKSVNPSLTQADVYDAWRATSRDQIGSGSQDTLGRDNYYGWGLIDAAAAVAYVRDAMVTDAVNDAFNVVRGSGVTNLNVLGNDQGANLSITAVSTPTLGSVAIAAAGKSVNYTPPASGSADSFTYTVSNAQGVDTATVTITLTAPPPIVANNDSASTPQGTAKSIAVLANDTGSNLTIASVTQGQQGTVAISGSNVVYTPNASYVGADSFTYTITGQGGGTSTATVSMTVTAAQNAYCKSGGTSSSNYISFVRFGNFTNTSGAGNNGDPNLGPLGYTSFTNQTITLTRGSSTSYQITKGGGGPAGFRVWIDLNQNGTFDTADQVVSRGLFNTSVSGSFTVPSSAASGPTRLRVSVKLNNFQQACEVFGNGEVEDYTAVLN